MALSRRSGGPELFGVNLRNAALRLLVNALAILVAANLIDGITVSGWQAVLLAAAIFGVVNALVKPAVRLLTCPLYILTLGLFAFVVNALMLALTAWIAEQASIDFHVSGFGPAFAGAIVIALVSWTVSILI